MKKWFKVAVATLLAVACMMCSACNSGSELKVIDVELTAETYAYAMKKSDETGDSSLKDSVNNILLTMQEDGTLEFLINSYFDGSATFTYKNETATPQAGDFIVATNAYFPPFEYYVGSSFAGIDIEIAHIIATSLGKTLYVNDMQFNAIIPSVQNGSCTIGMAGMTVTETRLQQVDFSVGYYESAQVLTVRADNTEFDGKTADEIIAILGAKDSSYVIGTQISTTGYMFSAGDADFGYDGFANLTTRGYNSGALAMRDLSNGNIDAVLLDKQPSFMITESMNN